MRTFLLLASGLFLLGAAPLQNLHAAHIIGGEITYKCLGFTRNDPGSNSRRYLFTLKIYRDCLAPGSNFDSTPGNFPASVTLYRSSQTNRPMVHYLSAPKVTKIQPDPGNACVDVPQNVCVEQGVFELELDLPIIPESYILSYQRCCRNNTITNIVNPERSGATYTIELTAEAQSSCNNSPVFRFFPPIALCAGTAFTVNHSGADAEGDSLTYELCPSLLGGGENGILPHSANGVAPDPDLPPPYAPVVYQMPTFSSTQPLGATAAFRLDPATGIMTGAPQQLGQFVVGVCMSEYRNGQLLSRVIRDFQFNITRCERNVVADIQEDSLSADGQFLVQSCGATTVTLINQSVKRELIQDFRWEFDVPGGILTSTQWDGMLAFPAPGAYTGRLLLNPGTLCADTASVEVRILPPVKADFAITGDTCSDQPLQFVNQTDTGGQPVKSYSWNFGDGSPQVSASDPSYQYPKAGTWTVKLNVSTADGCTGQAEKALNVYPLPSSLSIQANPAFGCTPSVINFTNSNLGPFKSSYQLKWDFGNGETAGQENPVYTFRQAGQYPVSLKLSTPSGCAASANLPTPLNIEEGVLARFAFSPEKPESANPTVAFQDLSVNAQSWNWDFGGLGQSADPNPQFTFPPAGAFTIRLIASTDALCKDTFEQTIVIDPTIKAYWPTIFSPNNDGVNDLFKPEGGLFGVGTFQFTVYSRWGNPVFQTQDPQEGWNGKFQNTGNELPGGVYFYRAIVKDAEGKTGIKEGTITLIR